MEFLQIKLTIKPPTEDKRQNRELYFNSAIEIGRYIYGSQSLAFFQFHVISAMLSKKKYLLSSHSQLCKRQSRAIVKKSYCNTKYVRLCLVFFV